MGKLMQDQNAFRSLGREIIARALALRGPSIRVNTAFSSSLHKPLQSALTVRRGLSTWLRLFRDVSESESDSSHNAALAQGTASFQAELTVYALSHKLTRSR